MELNLKADWRYFHPRFLSDEEVELLWPQAKKHIKHPEQAPPGSVGRFLAASAFLFAYQSKYRISPPLPSQRSNGRNSR